jgi:DNA-binding transcriptional ArsR family regulator
MARAEETVDRIFKALANPTRRRLLSSVRRGREKHHYLNPVPIHEIYDRWVRKFERRGLKALADLKRQLEGGNDD